MSLCIKGVATCSHMGHIRDAACLCFKTRPSATTFLVKMILYYRANKTHFHKKRFALGLVLRVSVFGTRKWPVGPTQMSHRGVGGGGVTD